MQPTNQDLVDEFEASVQKLTEQRDDMIHSLEHVNYHKPHNFQRLEEVIKEHAACKTQLEDQKRKLDTEWHKAHPPAPPFTTFDDIEQYKTHPPAPLLTIQERIAITRGELKDLVDARDELILTLEKREQQTPDNFDRLVDLIEHIAYTKEKLVNQEDEFEYAYNRANSAVGVRIERLEETIRELKEEYERPVAIDKGKYDQILLAQKLMDTFIKDQAEVDRTFGRNEEPAHD